MVRVDIKGGEKMTPEMEAKMIKALEEIAEALKTLSELVCEWWNVKYGR